MKDSDTAPLSAAQLGAEMKAARRKLGWELPQLAASLRIRQAYLEAIEDGRVADLPGRTYALGFVRTYAAALGLPAEEVTRRFRADAMDAEGRPALRFPAPVPQRGVPAGALMLLGLLILGGAYGGWYWFTARRATPVETVPPIPDRIARAAPQPAPSPQVATILPSTAPPSPAPPPSAAAPNAQAPAAHAPPTSPPPSPGSPTAAPPAPPQATAQPAPPSGATAGGAGTDRVASPGAVPPPASPPATPGASPPAGAAPSAPAGTRIVIRTSADAWLTVKQKSGPPVLNKLMHAGDSFALPADREGLTLTTGNAGGTVIEVDGAPIPVSLGGSGMVRRDLPLDADTLKAGKLPPPASRTRVRPAAAAPPG